MTEIATNLALTLAERTERTARSVLALGSAIHGADVHVSPQVARATQAEQNLYDEIEAEFGLLTSAEAGRRMGSRSAALRNAATSARRDGRLLALRRGGYWLFPGFQFDAGGVRPIIAELIRLGHQQGRTEAGLIQWLCSPTGYLGAKRPVDVIESPTRVLDAARNAFGIQW